MAAEDQLSFTDECALANVAFFQPYHEMKLLADSLGRVDIYSEEEVHCAIRSLERLDDLFWNFFHEAPTALTQEEIQTLFALYHHHLADLKQNEGVRYRVAEQSFRCCRNLVACFLGFTGDWYSWFSSG